jgi:hypothetical protein
MVEFCLRKALSGPPQCLSLASSKIDGRAVALKNEMYIIRERKTFGRLSLIDAFVRNDPDALMLAENSEKITLLKESGCAKRGIDSVSIALKQEKGAIYREKIIGVAGVIKHGEIRGNRDQDIARAPMGLEIAASSIIIGIVVMIG